MDLVAYAEVMAKAAHGRRVQSVIISWTEKAVTTEVLAMGTGMEVWKRWRGVAASGSVDDGRPVYPRPAGASMASAWHGEGRRDSHSTHGSNGPLGK